MQDIVKCKEFLRQTGEGQWIVSYFKRSGKISDPGPGYLILSEAIKALSDHREKGDRRESRKEDRVSINDKKNWILLTSRVDIDDSTGCWNYNGPVSEHGYGIIYTSIRGSIRERNTHRTMYRFLVGPIPHGLHIDHLCRNRRCCNPKHLEAVTPAVNALRGLSPRAVNAAKTHCKHGHPLSGDNLMIRVRETIRRECKECRRNVGAAVDKRRAAKRALARSKK